MKHKTTGSLVKKKKTAEHYNHEKWISLFSFLSIWIFCKMFRKKNKTQLCEILWDFPTSCNTDISAQTTTK